jgi:hypothetical protein
LTAQVQARGTPPTVNHVVEQAHARAAVLVGKMTLDEKLGQLLNIAPAIPRLGIPACNWWTESLHGAIGFVPTANYPEPIGLAATFDTPLAHRVAFGISTIALRGFRRVTLEPGERRTIAFDLSSRDLSAVTTDGVREVMAGNYQVSVGSGQPGTGVPVQTARFSAQQSAPLPQ